MNEETLTQIPAGQALPAPSEALKISSLRNGFRGRRCFIMGNGPSLNQINLELLKGEYVWGSNRCHLLFDRISWRPSFYVFQDPIVIKNSLKEIQQWVPLLPKTQFFLPYTCREFFSNDTLSAANIFWYLPEGSEFSLDVSKRISNVHTVTATSLQIATYLGFNPIYLIGCDLSYAHGSSVAEPSNHFAPDYLQKGKSWSTPNVQGMLEDFSKAKKACETIGISILNATPGGRLEEFPRVAYDALFPLKKESAAQLPRADLHMQYRGQVAHAWKEINALYQEVQHQLPRQKEKCRRLCPFCQADETETIAPQYEFILERCLNCGFVFLNDLFDPDAQQAIDNTFTQLQRTKNGYFCLHPEAGIMGDFEKEVRYEVLYGELRLLKAILGQTGCDNPRGKTFLDVGCFKGYSILAAQLLEMQALGVEFDPKRIRFAKEVLGVSIVPTLFEDLLEQERRFDLITARHVLEHIHDPFSFLQKALDLLSPTGHLMLLLPNFYSNLVHRMYQAGEPCGDFTIHHVNYFDLEKTVQLVQRAGFSIRFAGTLSGPGTWVSLHKRYGIGPGFVGWYHPIRGRGPLRYQLKQGIKNYILYPYRRWRARAMVRGHLAFKDVSLSQMYGDPKEGSEICILASRPGPA